MSKYNNYMENIDEINLYYKDKYIKYKTKYLELKKILDRQQKGGSYFYEQNDLIRRMNILVSKKKSKKDLYQFSSIYFKTNLTNPNIIKKYAKIRKSILKNNTPPPFNYHLTMLILEVNLDYPLHLFR